MGKVSMLGLLLVGACAHQAPVPTLRAQLMARCAAVCEPAEAVEALVAVDETDDLWQCHCKSQDVTTNPTGI